MSSKKENLPYQTTVIEVTETSIIGAKSLSVKMDEHRYKQLRLNALEKGMTHREIMIEAFDLWIRLHGVT